MTLGLLFLISFLVLVVVSGGLFWLFAHILAPLVPAINYIHTLVQLEIIIAVALGIVAIVFLVLRRVIGRPMRELTRVMALFVAKGTRTTAVTSSFSPREIIELKQSLEQFMENVENAHKRDVEVSRVKSDFISTAAHQLRTPLTGIRWALEALEKDNITEEQHSLVKSAADKSRELVSIVGTLLDISAIESGKYKYVFESVNLDALALEIVQDFMPLAKTKNVSLQYLAPDGLVAPVRADRERIKWVLTNLVENAVRYTPEGGSVIITMGSGAGRVYVMVRDNGIGIPLEDRGNIFERFYRAGNAVAKENQGNGLGLYIARTIANDHGGDLNFNANEDGPGTTFVLSLPSL
ncbi:MAG: HAMP domain-containing sensor histidine kinase [Minisyncoccia bacterium]